MEGVVVGRVVHARHGDPARHWLRGGILGVSALLLACNEGTAPAATAAKPSLGAAVASKAETRRPRLVQSVKALTVDEAFVEILGPEENHLTGRSGSNFTIAVVPEAENPDPGKIGFAGTGNPLKSLVLIADTYTGGGCANLARFFYTDILNSTSEEVEFMNTWRVTGPKFSLSKPTTIRAAIVSDLNGNGKLDDAPYVVPDANYDHACDASDLNALGIVSPISEVTFTINPGAN
jgi:hypothetical protein